MRQLQITFKTIGFLILGASFVGFTGSEKFITLNQYMNARASSSFTQDRSNVKFVISPGTNAEIIGHRKFFSGNYGLRVRLTSGSRAGEVVWVYYNMESPTMNLSHRNPGAATAAETTAPTPASETPPREVASTEAQTVATSADSCANGACVSISGASELGQTQSFVQDFVDRTSRNAAVGARRVMANMYQSCSVLGQAPYNPNDRTQGNLAGVLDFAGGTIRTRALRPENLSSAVREHYYLREQGSVGSQCMDMKQTPPVYHYGARPGFSEGGQMIDIFTAVRRGGQTTVGLDCSAFISVALSAAGLKMNTGVRTAAANMTTSYGLVAMNERNSCFRRDALSSGSDLQSGDIVAWNGHTLMVDQVGQDPLGIERLNSQGRLNSRVSCDRISEDEIASLLNFTILQSSGSGNFPAARMKAKDYAQYADVAQDHFSNLFRMACYAQFASDRGRRFQSETATTFLRHKGDEDPRCSFPQDSTPKLKNEECTRGCPQEVMS